MLDSEHILKSQGFLPLEDLVQQVPLRVRREVFPSQQPVAAKLLQNDPELLHQAAEALEERGFRRFQYFSQGGFALLFQTTDHQLVRLSDPTEPPRPHEPFVLGTLEDFKVNLQDKSIAVEILPEIDPRQQGYSFHVQPLQRAALEAGYIDVAVDMLMKVAHYSAEQAVNAAYDVKDPIAEIRKENILTLRDDAPLIIDSGAIIHHTALPQGQEILERVQKTMSLRSTSARYKWTLPDDTWKQHAQYPELASGTLKNVLSESDLKRLSELEGNKAVVDAVRTDGRYRSEMSAILMDAAARGGNETQEGFERGILEERAARSTSKSPENNSRRRR